MGGYEEEREKLDRLRTEGRFDTLPKRLRHMSEQRPGTVAMRKKALGIWNEYTWADCYERVKCIGLGLTALGLERGDKVCIVGDNDPEWFWAELAVQSAGGVAIGIYIDSVPSEIEYIA
ncbi:MAG: AMP-binding protein, partial [Proteobacteria bacterium]|nr:AMP-binding protein [Pseudomonadota bacterium]